MVYIFTMPKISLRWPWFAFWKSYEQFLVQNLGHNLHKIVSFGSSFINLSMLNFSCQICGQKSQFRLIIIIIDHNGPELMSRNLNHCVEGGLGKYWHRLTWVDWGSGGKYWQMETEKGGFRDMSIAVRVRECKAVAWSELDQIDADFDEFLSISSRTSLHFHRLPSLRSQFAFTKCKISYRFSCLSWNRNQEILGFTPESSKCIFMKWSV